MTNYDADVIIIGSGAGGLAAGLALTQAGKKVLILEQHYVAGGWCHSFTRDSFSFSPGLHYLGGLGPGQENNLFFQQLGLGSELSFYQMNPNAYDQALISGKRFNFSSNFQTMTQDLCSAFPHESVGILSYQNLLTHLMDEFLEVFKTSSWRERLSMPYRTRHIGRYGLYTLDHILRKRIADPLIRAILSVQCGNQGLPPSRTMFLLQAGVARHYRYGGFYPQGGGRGLTQAFCRQIKAGGGRLLKGCEVSTIMTEKQRGFRKALGVRLADGREFRSRAIISNADPHNTFAKLVGREFLSKSLVSKLKSSAYSLSSLHLFLGFDSDVRNLGLTSGNVWYSKVTDFDLLFKKMQEKTIYENEEFDSVFISSPTLKDPSSAKNGRHTLEVVTFVAYKPFEKYRETSEENRPKEYQELKLKIKNMFFKTLEKIIPGFRDSLVFSDLGTPLSNAHYINSTLGAVYGTEKNYKQLGPFSYRQKTEITDLYLAGASTTSHGVLGAARSGVQAAALVLGCESRELLISNGPPPQIFSAELFQ